MLAVLLDGVNRDGWNTIAVVDPFDPVAREAKQTGVGSDPDHPFAILVDDSNEVIQKDRPSRRRTGILRLYNESNLRPQSQSKACHPAQPSD